MSTDEYTPDEETVREQYSREQPPHIGTVSGKQAEFDRFLAKVKRDAVMEVRAEFYKKYPYEPPLLDEDRQPSSDERVGAQHAMNVCMDFLAHYPEETQ